MLFHFPKSSAKRLAGIALLVGGTACLLPAQVPNTLRHSFFAPSTAPQTSEQQGHHVAMTSGLTVVGCPFFDADIVDCPDSGLVRIYDNANGNLLHVLPNPEPAAFDYFGRSVAVSGNKVAVSTGRDETGTAYAGSVYVFDLSSATPTLPTLRLNNPEPAAYDVFGQAIAIDGNRVAVGAWLDDTAATNSGSVYIYNLASGPQGIPSLVLTNPGPAEDDCFGAAVALSGTRLLVAAYQDDSAGTNAGAVYLYQLDGDVPDIPEATFLNPSPETDDFFGNSVAISGALAVVGLESDDTGAPESGAVYFYNLDTNPTAPVLMIANPTPGAGDRFGTAVAISGSRLLVGSYQDDSSGANTGAAYLFETSGALVSTYHPPLPGADDFFGNSLAIAGTKAVVAAKYADEGGLDSGSAYLFDSASATPAQALATFGSPTGSSQDRFGNSVALSGTFVAVGAPLDDAGATDSGRVTVYQLSSVKPTTPFATILNPTAAVGDGFGSSVALAGSLLVVGAPGDDTTAANSGRAYVFDLAAENPASPVYTLAKPGPAAGDGFGGSVSIDGSHVVVGAAGDNTGATDAGRAFVFDLASGNPTVPIALSKPGASAGDAFGTSVAISGTRIAVGISKDDTGATDTGAVRIFDLTGSLLSTLPNPAAAANDQFGSSVAISGDRVIVGSSGNDTGAVNAGLAFVFDLATSNPSIPAITLPNPAPAADDRFGDRVAISGTRAVTGAYQDDVGASNAGRVYLYDLTSGTPAVHIASLGKSTPKSGDQLGSAVAIDSLTIAVGTPFDDKTATDKGAAYIFGPSAPEIVVESGIDEELASGTSSIQFGVAAEDSPGDPLEVTISNTGITVLTITSITRVGGNSADFILNTTGMGTTVPAGDSKTFSISFAPSEPGPRTTTLQIVTNDVDESPFVINLLGTGLSSANDTDGDGLNDVAELRMAGLGFDWTVSQPALVQTFLDTLAPAGLHPESEIEDIQELRLSVPALDRGPGANVKIRIALEEATPSGIYQPLSFGGLQPQLNPQGELEFKIENPDDAPFLRLQTK